MNNEQQTMNSFMQNKPNFPDAQMNISYVKIKSYEQRTMNNEPIKQTQSNPTPEKPEWM